MKPKETNDKTTKTAGRRQGTTRSEMQCVSFLTLAGLKWHLDALVKAKKIGHYWAVEHEADEDTKKRHQHVRMTPPPSRAVNWSEIADGIREMVEGEELPRRLVLDARSVNDKREDGLLYARHDARYCAVKGLTKAHYDYPPSAFITDDRDWFDGLWSAADSFSPEPKRQTAAELLAMIERNPNLTEWDLLRACIVANLPKGQSDMLEKARIMLRRDAEAARQRQIDEEWMPGDAWDGSDWDPEVDVGDIYN